MRVVAGAFVTMQFKAACVTSSEEASAVYAWIGHGGVYGGLTRLRRATAPADPGAAVRWHEHENLRAKKSLPDSGRFRYITARRAPQGSISFLIMMTGSFHSISALESIFIKTLNPNMTIRAHHGTRGQ